jgi:Zn-dependent peptidase ImmA (M78 family)
MPKQYESITLQPAVLRWARERVGYNHDQLATHLKLQLQDIVEWERSGRISFAKVDDLSKHTYTPVGYLYLAEPPDDSLPIADFRTRAGASPQRPSPNLLDTIYQMQRRQAWMREEMIEQEDPPLEFVGAFSLNSPPPQVSAAMGQALQLSGSWAAVEGSWTNALRTLRDRIESASVLVIFNGVVGNDTRRKLDVDEFQGFALVDEYAPLIFVNNADYKTAQIFTLAHELSHIFVGESGLSKFENLSPTDHTAEEICNKISAEFLVPGEDLYKLWDTASQSSDPYQDIAKHFKVSTVVAARRAFDARLITGEDFFEYYHENKAKNWGGTQEGTERGGGDFWNNQLWRVGARFGGAVSRAVIEGRVSYTDAYSLTGLKGDTFSNMPEKMGLPL